MALAPQDMDFVSNFSTVWAVFLGAVLATLGGFAATQVEWYIERRRRQRNAALFFGEVLSTLNVILKFAENATKIGDPYGPITMRLFRSAMGEVDIYSRNRETLYDISYPDLRARIHTLVLRVSMTIDGIIDFTNTIAALDAQADLPTTTPEERAKLQVRIATLQESRQGSFEFMMENAEHIRGVAKELEPIARFSFDDVEKSVRRANP